MYTSTVTYENKPDTINFGVNTDHLGNIRALVSDKRIMGSNNNLEASLLGYNDYYPYGMLQPGRSFNAGDYRFGFGSYEKDDEIRGSSGSMYTTEFRAYDPLICRWWSTDPITHAMYSPYSAFDNNPIYYVDPSGADSENENKDDLNESVTNDDNKSKTGNENTNTEADKLQKELNQAKSDLSEANKNLQNAKFASNVAEELTTTGAVKGITLTVISEFKKQVESGKISKEQMKEYLNDPEKFQAAIDKYVNDYSSYLNKTGFYPSTVSEEEYRQQLIGDLGTIKDVAVLAANLNPYVKAASTVINVSTKATVRVYKNKVHSLKQKVKKLEKKFSNLQQGEEFYFIFGGGSFGGSGAGSEYE